MKTDEDKEDYKEGESESDYENRNAVYEIVSSMTVEDQYNVNIRPWADMIDSLTYVQKADFAKHALDLEKDLATYKAMFEEKGRELNGWIAECQSLKAQKQQLEKSMQYAAQLLQSWIHDHGPHNESIIFVQKYWNKENIFPYEI
jgi:type IV secretory pathway VirJ component